MSVLYSIECNGCRFVQENVTTDTKASDARKRAKEEGWVRRNEFDYCPDCVKVNRHKGNTYNETTRLYE